MEKYLWFSHLVTWGSKQLPQMYSELKSQTYDKMGTHNIPCCSYSIKLSKAKSLFKMW